MNPDFLDLESYVSGDCCYVSSPSSKQQYLLFRFDNRRGPIQDFKEVFPKPLILRGTLPFESVCGFK